MPKDSPDLHEVTTWTDRAFWNRASRSMRFHSPTVLELRLLQVPRMRLLFGTIFLFFASIATYDAIFEDFSLFDSLHADFERIFFIENRLVVPYDRYRTSVIYSGGTPESFEQFVADHIAWKPVTDRILNALPTLFVFLCFFIAPFLITFFTPAYLPLRVDREKRLIYTKRGRRLYVARFGHSLERIDIDREALDGYGKLLDPNSATAPALTITLYRADRPAKARTFQLGSYPLTSHKHQASDMIKILETFTYQPEPGATGPRARPYDPSWQKNLYRDAPLWGDFLRNLLNRTFGRHPKFDDARLEPILLDHATRPGA